LRQYEQCGRVKLSSPLLVSGASVRTMTVANPRCPAPGREETMKKMSCPGLVAKSGISWTLRAGQAGQGGQAGVVVTKTRGTLACATWGEGRCREMPREEESFLGRRPTNSQRRGGGGRLARLAGPGGGGFGLDFGFYIWEKSRRRVLIWGRAWRAYCGLFPLVVFVLTFV
jgi:hypothetical protein